ncbi:MAG: uncharacterized membrane protein YgdD (TMEM256/DUF423 family) [Gammaproteobacteria bacterium]|jgi:uncharacterized membrane protein YgdD (TMEM256/DUF423 family)
MSESSRRLFVIAAAILGALGVAAGAFGAHGLADTVSPRLLDVWHTAARYQMWHVLAILIIVLSRPQRLQQGLLTAACLAWLLGIVVFSGSLYALVLSGVRLLGAVTPLGGLALLTGWVLLACAALRQSQE